MTQPQDVNIESEIPTIQSIKEGTGVRPYENTFEEGEPVVALALDLAELSLDKIWKMNLYLPAIEQCYTDSMEEGDEDMEVIEEPLQFAAIDSEVSGTYVKNDLVSECVIVIAYNSHLIFSSYK